jgi:hypothetical protein
VNKIKTAEGVERLENSGTEKLANIPALSAEELFQLAAQLEIRATSDKEERSQSTLSRYVE